MVHGALAIANCINLEKLDVRGNANLDKGNTRFLLLLSPQLQLPLLRHLSLSFNLNSSVFDFLQRHYRQLSTLSIQHQGHGSPREELEACRMYCAQYSLPLPPSCSVIQCSPALTPIFIPNSHVRDVSLFCSDRFSLDTPMTAEDVVHTLSQSQQPVTAIRYVAYGWNPRFMAHAGLRLSQLQYLCMESMKHKTDNDLDRDVQVCRDLSKSPADIQ